MWLPGKNQTTLIQKNWWGIECDLHSQHMVKGYARS